MAPLAASTLARKRNRKILTETTRLRGSMAYRASSDQLEVGTNVVYGAIHQLGGGAHGRKGAWDFLAEIGSKYVQDIPARPYLGLNDDDEHEILALLRDHLERG